MSATIDTATLKTIRKARKIGRPKLAKLTGMTERQISRLEANDVGMADIAPGVLTRISDALRVPSAVLTGELPATEEDMKPLSEICCSTPGCCG